jgi:hypothetical protein
MSAENVDAMVDDAIAEVRRRRDSIEAAEAGTA